MHAIEESGQTLVVHHVVVEILHGGLLQVAVRVNVVDGKANVLKDGRERDEYVAAAHACVVTACTKQTRLSTKQSNNSNKKQSTRDNSHTARSEAT